MNEVAVVGPRGPRRPAGRLSLGALDTEASALAALLAGRGAEPGDCIALVLPSGTALAIGLLAIMRLGGTVAAADDGAALRDGLLIRGLRPGQTLLAPLTATHLPMTLLTTLFVAACWHAGTCGADNRVSFSVPVEEPGGKASIEVTFVFAETPFALFQLPSASREGQ